MEKEGYRSAEEHAGDCIEFFLGLGQGKDADLLRGEAQRIEEKEETSEIFLPARCLREQCMLGRTEYWLVLFAFCCEVEEGLCLAFRETYREKWPTLQYALHLISQIFPVDFGLIGAFCGENGIFGGLWEPRREGADEGGILTRPLLLARAPFYFLLTGRMPKGDWYTLCLPQDWGAPCLALHEKESAWLAHALKDGAGGKVLLHGGLGCGKHTLLRRVCGEQGKNLVFVRLARLLGKEARGRAQALRTLRFFSRMLTPALAFELSGTNAAREEETREFLEYFTEDGSGAFGQPLVFLTENGMEFSLVEKTADQKIFLAETLPTAERGLALDLLLGQGGRQEWQEELIGRSHVSIGELSNCCRALLARAQAEHRSIGEKALWEETLFAGSGIVGAGLGKFVKERANMNEIVLAPECRHQLNTIIQLAKVWDGRRAMQILFHGGPGTGKTMAASVLAAELARPLFKVDLSQVFDKYIGETEKHIDEIFRLAERGSYLLFFDEADALFARRTTIQDSHDRHANASTSYLLQRMEEYRGLLVLATNLMGHFDDAFVRRIQFVLRFQKPGEKERELLWEKALHGEFPLADGLSFAELARAAQFSPARISSAAQVAKMLTVCDGGGRITRKIMREALLLEAGKDETRLQFAGGHSDGEGL